MWSEIADSLIRLGGQKYKEIIQRQKIDSIDSEDANHYRSLLQSWENRDDMLLEEMRKVALGASNSNSKAEILIRGIIKMVTAGGLALTFAAGSAFFLSRYQNDPDTIIDLGQGAIIPASVATGLAVKEILRGLFIIKVQVSSMEALKALWKSYLRGDLSQQLQEVIITEKLLELAPRDHHQILIDLTISEDIKQAQICLMKKEKDTSAFDLQKGKMDGHEVIQTNTNLGAMSGNDTDSGEDDYDKTSILKDIMPKKVNGLMTVDLSNYDVIPNFPDFSNNLQVIRMSTRMLESNIPDSFCQLKCLKELFLYGDALQSKYGLSSLPANFGNLKTLEVLNLEHNCFIEFPEQICDLIKLEKLYLNECGLTAISPKINHLKNLLEIDLSDNDFSSGLCPELFELQSLKDLYLMNCSLTNLPEEIGNLRFLEGLRLIDNMLTEFPERLYTMKHLKKLAASKNRITQISPSIIGLQSLKVLLLGENMLTFLPNEISKLQALKVLNLFGNRLTCLPESIVDLAPSIQIIIHENHYLQKPPLSVCSKGIDSIRGFFSSMAKSNKLHSNRIKIIMLGEAGAGKTFLTHALVNCKACETENNDSTIGVEMHHCPFGEDQGERLEACIVDCAGQRRYQLTHPFFLSEESLHIIVVNLKTYQTTKKKSESESFKRYVEDWINWITARLWKPRIMIVGTHRDELSDVELSEKCSDILKRIEKHEQREIQRLEREIKETEKTFREKDREGARLKVEDLKWLKNNRPIMSSRVLLGDNSMYIGTEKPQHKENEPYLNLVAVASTEELKGMILLRNEICRVAGCRTSSSHKKEGALFPLIGIDLPKSWLNLEKAIIEYRQNCKASEVPCMAMEQFEKFACKEAGLEGSEVTSGLHYLDSVGEIKFYDCNIPRTHYSVFLDLPWLCKLVKLLFRHDYEEDGAIEFKDEYSNCGMEKIKFEIHLKELKEGGRLSLDLLKCFWVELSLTDHEISNMTRSLVVFGLACEIPLQNDFFIPWFLHSKLDSKEKQEIFPNLPESGKIELRLKFSIVGYLPTGVFHRLCVRCYSLGIDVTTWKNSMLIYKEDTQIYLEMVESEITVTGRSPQTDIKPLWSAILGIVKELRQLLSEWPRIVYNTYTVCPKCIKRNAKKPYHFPRKWWKDENFEDARCKEKKSEVIEARLLVPPPEVLNGQGASLVQVVASNLLLRDLSQRLPDDWETLGTYLGLSDHGLVSIKQNHAGNVNEMAYAMFSKWRQLKGKNATQSTLINALKKSGREDLVNYVWESIH